MEIIELKILLDGLEIRFHTTEEKISMIEGNIGLLNLSIAPVLTIIVTNSGMP